MDPADRTNEVMERQAETDRRAAVKRLSNVSEREWQVSMGIVLSRRCEDCNHPILAARLTLVPDTRRCTSCQNEQEEREGRIA